MDGQLEVKCAISIVKEMGKSKVTSKDKIIRLCTEVAFLRWQISSMELKLTDRDDQIGDLRKLLKQYEEKANKRENNKADTNEDESVPANGQLEFKEDEKENVENSQDIPRDDDQMSGNMDNKQLEAKEDVQKNMEDSQKTSEFENQRSESTEDENAKSDTELRSITSLDDNTSPNDEHDEDEHEHEKEASKCSLYVALRQLVTKYEREAQVYAVNKLSNEFLELEEEDNSPMNEENEDSQSLTSHSNEHEESGDSSDDEIFMKDASCQCDIKVRKNSRRKNPGQPERHYGMIEGISSIWQSYQRQYSVQEDSTIKPPPKLPSSPFHKHCIHIKRKRSKEWKF